MITMITSCIQTWVLIYRISLFIIWQLLSQSSDQLFRIHVREEREPLTSEEPLDGGSHIFLVLRTEVFSLACLPGQFGVSVVFTGTHHNGLREPRVWILRSVYADGIVSDGYSGHGRRARRPSQCIMPVRRSRTCALLWMFRSPRGWDPSQHPARRMPSRTHR